MPSCVDTPQVSQTTASITENVRALVRALIEAKPKGVKEP